MLHLLLKSHLIKKIDTDNNNVTVIQLFFS
jgi:hypothetical protein